MTEEKKVSRRTFVAGSVGGLVVGAAAGALAGYYSAPPAVGGVTSTAKPTATPNVLLNSTFHDPTSMDPHKNNDEPTTRYVANLYDPLVRVNGVPGAWIAVEPHLAKTWDISSDGLEYVLHLRRGVRFHDGSILDANAVKYSIERALAINMNFSAMSIKPFVSAVGAPSTYDVKVTLKQRYSPFIQVMPCLYMVNPKLVEANIKPEGPYGDKGDYGTLWLETNDAGSGPYSLKERRTGELTVYERFPDYWEGWGPQYFDEYRVSFVSEVPTIAAQLAAGQSDWGEIWLPEETFNDLEKTGACVVPQWADASGTFTILLNNQNRFLKNKLVRQAMSYAFDYETCIRDIWGSKGLPSTGPIPTGMIGYNSEVQMYARDIAKAKDLMAQSGFKPGDVKIDALYTTGEEPRRLMSLLMQQNFAELGIELAVKDMPWAPFTSALASMNVEDSFAITFLAGSIAVPDPDDILTRFYYSKLWEVTGLKSYYTCSYYKNETVDALIEQGRSAPTSQRDAIYKQATKLIIEDAASIWPVWQYTRTAIRPDIEGFRPLPFNFTNFMLDRRNSWYRVKS